MPTIRPCVITLALVALIATDVFARGNSEKKHSDAAATSELARATSIQFAPELRSEVDDLLRRSPTFRAQYQRIAAAGSVVVGVRVDVSLCETSYRARTTFHRYQSGVIVAAVVIRPGAR